MYLWRRTAKTHWVETHQDLLQAHAHGHLVLVQRPGRKRLELEIACASRRDSSALVRKFGGRIEALPRNWLKFAHTDSKPIKIGKRLVIARSINELEHCSVRCVPSRTLSRSSGPQRSSPCRTRPDAHTTARTINPALLIIPASLAFGTGEHVTTAMSLRFLEKLTRRWNCGWSLVDVGTGTGILALAAKYFGAERVTGVDNDPAAISVARSNARLNKIRGVSFHLGDVHKWRPAQETNVITANLYSDLLLEIVPKLHAGKWLILSGILRSQQGELVSALHRNQFDIISVKRRGKWVAILACKGDL